MVDSASVGRRSKDRRKRAATFHNSMTQFLKRWLITTLAVAVAANTIKGISYDTGTALALAALMLGLLDAFVRPLMILLSLPLLIFSLGFFLIVINALLLMLVGSIIKGFHVAGFWPAFWGSLVISLVSIVLNSLTKSGDSRMEFRRGKQPPSSHKDDGQGPVIDV